MFYINGERPGAPYELLTVALHETVPGRHLLCALTLEDAATDGRRDFRLHNGIGVRYTDAPGSWPSSEAFVEGWTEYAEGLGGELGLADATARFGALSSALVRACQLVVDTGLHALHWSRYDAETFLERHTVLHASTREEVVRRAVAWPGQAATYAVGAMRFRALRQKAKDTLGEAFDVRAWHDELLRRGPLPLELLEGIMEEWLAEQQKELQ